MNNNGLIVSCITNDRLLSMKQLINKLKKNNNYVIYKGARTSKRGLSEIIYIVAINEKATISRKYIRDGIRVLLTKRNEKRNSTMEFACWDFVEVNNGQLTGSSMNIMNDSSRYIAYIIE